MHDQGCRQSQGTTTPGLSKREGEGRSRSRVPVLACLFCSSEIIRNFLLVMCLAIGRLFGAVRTRFGAALWLFAGELLLSVRLSLKWKMSKNRISLTWWMVMMMKIVTVVNHRKPLPGLMTPLSQSCAGAPRLSAVVSSCSTAATKSSPTSEQHLSSPAAINLATRPRFRIHPSRSEKQAAQSPSR